VTKVEHDHWRRQAAFCARQVVPTYPAEDMIAEGMASLVTSLRTYKPGGRVSLGGHVLNHMRWAMLDAARAWRPGTRADAAKGIFHTEVELDEARDAATLPAVDTDRMDLERAVATLPPRRRAYVEAFLRTGDVALAAAAAGMSRECAWQHHWQAVRALRKLMVDPP
jgi:DNA-directed RNA polymerase specialized sigma24 family protein